MPNRIVYKYPLDLEGTSITNFMPGEKHTIGTSRGRIFIADSGPFFGNSIVVRDGVNGRELKPMLDYYLVHPYREAQEATAQPIYMGVRIVNPEVSTQIEIDVQYVGGEFSYTTRALLDMLEAVINDNRPIDWGELIGVPNEWVPAPHLHSAYDLYAMKHLVAATNDTAAAIREGWAPMHAHLFDMINGRIEVFERVVPGLIDCYDEGNDLLASIDPGASGDPIDDPTHNAVPITRVIGTGTGLTGGGALNTNRTLSVVFGTTSTTVMRGDDQRANNGQIAYNWGDHSTQGYMKSTDSINATTATRLQTARNLTIGRTAKSFNGSANVAWTLAEILPLGGTSSNFLRGDGTWATIETGAPANMVTTNTAQTVTGAKTFSAATIISNTGNATSATTGALRVAGGIGVAADIWSGGRVTASNLTIATNITVNGTANATSTTTGALQTRGGLGVASSIYAGGDVSANTVLSRATTNSTSATTGAMQTRGGLGVSGNIWAGGNITAYSDARLKRAVQPIDNALSKIEKSRGVYYTRIDTGIREVGLIAQELQKVLPEAVHGDEVLGIDYGRVVALLIEGIKDLSQQVKDLQAEMKANRDIEEIAQEIRELHALMQGR